MKFSRRLAFLAMPFRWLRNGCFDWTAARVAWSLAILGRPPRLPSYCVLRSLSEWTLSQFAAEVTTASDVEQRIMTWARSMRIKT